MRKLLYCAASTAALMLAANAADTAKPKRKVPGTPAKTQGAPKPAAPKTAAKPAAKPAATSKPVAPGTVGSRTGTGPRRAATPSVPKRPTTSWRNRQAVPTPDRYKEIQEALAAKGYLQPENASGHWDQTSVDALKKFQADQRLDSTGKLNSLSLIALGLGPKYEMPQAIKPVENAAPTVPPGENTAPTVTPVESR